MIPALVAILAESHKPSSLDALRSLAALAGPSDHAWIATTGAARERLDPLPPRPLAPDTPPANAVSDMLDRLSPTDIVPGCRSPAEALSVKAGLYLINDFLDQAHALAQQADALGRTTTASYWHGIMHRREPDYDNARYWCRRVGRHPTFGQLAHEAAQRMNDREFAARLQFDRVLDRRGTWDPMAFIDLCEQCGRTWNARAQAAAELQAIELRVLLEYTCQAVFGD